MSELPVTLGFVCCFLKRKISSSVLRELDRQVLTFKFSSGQEVHTQQTSLGSGIQTTGLRRAGGTLLLL